MGLSLLQSVEHAQALVLQVEEPWPAEILSCSSDEHGQVEWAAEEREDLAPIRDRIEPALRRLAAAEELALGPFDLRPLARFALADWLVSRVETPPEVKGSPEALGCLLAHFSLVSAEGMQELAEKVRFAIRLLSEVGECDVFASQALAAWVREQPDSRRGPFSTFGHFPSSANVCADVYPEDFDACSPDMRERVRSQVAQALSSRFDVVSSRCVETQTGPRDDMAASLSIYLNVNGFGPGYGAIEPFASSD
jgi:hypothetical protein